MQFMIPFGNRLFITLLQYSSKSPVFLSKNGL